MKKSFSDKDLIESIGDVKFNRFPIPPPQKRCFATMFELLKDAEKYDNENEMEVRNATLTALCEYIERLRAKKEESIMQKAKEMILNEEEISKLKEFSKSEQ